MINSWLSFSKKLGNGLITQFMIDTFPMKLNPIGKSTFWLFELYHRIKLFPWWIKYNIGLTEESELKDKISRSCHRNEFGKKMGKKNN